MTSRIEIRIGHRLMIRAVGSFAVLATVLGLLAVVTLFDKRLDRASPKLISENARQVAR